MSLQDAQEQIGHEETIDDDDIARVDDQLEQQYDKPGPLETPTISEYAQVIFQNVSESYKPGKHLECHYVLSTVITPHHRDWVGIFKVGWSSTRQYVAYDWSPFPKDSKPGCEHKQSVIFNSYYLPPQEDGEFYQFCYIDYYGKMRGASLPFQFLEHPMEDFMEIDDASMDILMIQNKHTFAEENLERLLKEKDSLISEKEEVETEKQALMEKVESLTDQLRIRETELKELVQESENSKKTIEEESKVKVEAITMEVGELKKERQRAEESLKQMEDALMELQKSMQALEEERGKLRKELQDVTKEKEEFKGQFASSENNNEVLRMEIDKLKRQLSDLAQQQETMKENEGQLQVEKRKIEHQLLVAAADKEHKIKLEDRVKQLERQLAALHEENKRLKEEIQALNDVQEKLSRDLEGVCVEKENAVIRLKRQAEDFTQKQKKAEHHMRLSQHKASEEKALLLDQVQALKDGMNKLAKENEIALKSDGSDAASQVAVKKFKDRMQKAEQNYKEEIKKRVELEKKLASAQVNQTENKEDLENQLKYFSTLLEEEKGNHLKDNQDLTKEVEDLKVRLEMGKKEYQKIYGYFKNMEEKYYKLAEGKKDQEVSVKQPMESEIVRETEQASQAAPQEEMSKSFTEDSRDRTMNMAELATQLADLMVELEKRKARALEYQKLYENERMKRKQKENLYKELQEVRRKKEAEYDQKFKQKKEELRTLQEQFSKLQNDYTHIKHINESLKFDQAAVQDKSDGHPVIPLRLGRAKSQEKSKEPAPVITDQIVPRGPPQQYQPYRPTGTDAPLRFGNPYTPEPSIDDAVASGMEKIYYPPQLTTPMSPTLTPEAKIVALKAQLKDAQIDEKGGSVTSSPDEDQDMYSPNIGPTPPSSPAAQVDSTEDMYGPQSIQEVPVPFAIKVKERSASPAEFHDAVEFQNVTAKVCPECGISFPSSFPDREFAKHIQQHHAKQCPKCETLLDRDITDQEYRRHLQQCREALRPPVQADSAPPKPFIDTCPVCEKNLTLPSEKLFLDHIDEHFRYTGQ